MSPVTTPPVEIAAAYRAGTSSWADASSNPHRGDADTARERVLSRAWQRGRQHNRPHRAALDRLDAIDVEQ